MRPSALLISCRSNLEVDDPNLPLVLFTRDWRPRMEAMHLARASAIVGAATTGAALVVRVRAGVFGPRPQTSREPLTFAGGMSRPSRTGIAVHMKYVVCHLLVQRRDWHLPPFVTTTRSAQESLTASIRLCSESSTGLIAIAPPCAG